ncbi:MAG: PH domain-containing protein [Anaerolineae bacterium]|nr:PH domain-containing protein [Anaerolineae bacterium]
MHYYPHRQYLVKLMLKWFLPLIIFNLPIVIGSGDGAVNGLSFLCFVDVVILILIFSSARLYFNSLRYEIYDDEIIVTAGVLTKSVKHVPFRTITNLTVTRSLLDRLLGIGSLQIQTAGASGTIAPEENLVGLENVDELYQRVAGELRRFRGGMSPDQASDNSLRLPTEYDHQEILLAILDELRAIHDDLRQS